MTCLDLHRFFHRSILEQFLDIRKPDRTRTFKPLPGGFAGHYYSSMIFLKCILAVLCFLFWFPILLFLGDMVFLTIFLAPGKGEAVGIDPVSMVRSSPILWVLALLFFLLGFSWEYRRVRSRQAG